MLLDRESHISTQKDKCTRRRAFKSGKKKKCKYAHKNAVKQIIKDERKEI